MRAGTSEPTDYRPVIREKGYPYNRSDRNMVWPGGLGCHYTLVSRTLGSAYMDSPFREISANRPAEREL